MEFKGTPVEQPVAFHDDSRRSRSHALYQSKKPTQLIKEGPDVYKQIKPHLREQADKASFDRRTSGPRTLPSTSSLASRYTLIIANPSAPKGDGTLVPTMRTLASGVPSASFLNLAARAPAGHAHGHGAVGPRSDVPAKWAGGIAATSSGLVSKTFTSGTCRSAHFVVLRRPTS